MSLADDEAMRSAQVEAAWEEAHFYQEALRDLHDALQVIKSFVNTPFEKVMAGDWE